MQIGGDLDVTGQVAEDHVKGRGDGHRADGQTVQAVGEVHGVGAAHDDKDGEGNEEPAQIRLHRLEEGHRQGGAVGRAEIEPQRRHQGHQGLPHQLTPAAEALIMLLDDLEIIVIKTDEAEAEGHQDQHPDVGIVQFRPEEGGGQGGEDDHQAAHGGGAVFGEMGLGAFLPDGLADLHGLELPDEPGAHRQGDDQGGEHGENGPEGDIPEDIKAAEDRLQWI